MNKMMIGTVAVAFVFVTGQAGAQQQALPPVGPDWTKVEIKTTDLGQRTYMLEGLGDNITVALAEDGVIMVDGQFAPLHDKIKAAIEALSKQPIRFLINTHYHGDHTGGNLPFAGDGAVVVAHINVQKRLAAGATMGVPEIKSAPVSGGALPTKTYTDALILELNGRVAQLKHAVGAHTDGDAYVYFADANVISTGDTVSIGRYPNIDFLNGGTVAGMIAAADVYLALANDTTKIVPGHGPLGTKAQLMEFRAMLVTARDRMAKLIAEGKTEADVLAAKPFADLDAKWAVSEQAGRNWMRVVYNSLKQ